MMTEYFERKLLRDVLSCAENEEWAAPDEYRLRALAIIQGQGETDSDLDLIACLIQECDRLRAMIDTTADGVLLPDTDKLFCPHCNNEVRVVIDIGYCDNCPNPDDYGIPPLPLFLSMCYARPQGDFIPK